MSENATGGAATDATTTRGYRKGREGYVVSDKMDKTVVVQVEDHVKHPKYGKVLRRTKKYQAHDATNACGVGDRVLLMETRPLSRRRSRRRARSARRRRWSGRWPVPAASGRGGHGGQRTRSLSTRCEH